MSVVSNETVTASTVQSDLEQWFQVTGDLDDFIFFFEDNKSTSDR